MLSIKEVTERVQSLYSKGVQSDDSRLSARHIYSKLKAARSKVLSDKVNKKQKLNHWSYNTLPCINMIKVKANQCPCEVPPGCEILRSEHKIPRLISGHSGHVIDSITSLNLDQVFSLVEVQEIKNQKGNRYTSDKGNAFFYNGYLFLSSKKAPKVLSMTAPFEDLIDVYNFESTCEECKNCGCESFLDKEFSLDLDSLETVIKMAVEELIGIFSKNIEDQTNNTKDNVTSQSK